MPIPATTLNIDFFEISPIPILVLSTEWEILKYNATAKGLVEDCNHLAKEGVTLSNLIPSNWRELNTFEITLNSQSYKITTAIEQDFSIFYFTSLNRLEKIIFQQRYYEQILDAQQFVRIHRSYILNVNYLTKIEPLDKNNSLAILKNGIKIPLSKTGGIKLKEVLSL